MPKADSGDTVKVHYTGTLDDDTVFDSSVDREPLELTIGQGQVIPGFEEAVIGLEPGESRTTTFPPEKGYGERREEMVLKVERDQLPPEIDPRVGERYQIQASAQGQPASAVTVVDVSDDHVVFDGNHPLAGRELTFEIELVEIR